MLGPFIRFVFLDDSDELSQNKICWTILINCHNIWWRNIKTVKKLLNAFAHLSGAGDEMFNWLTFVLFTHTYLELWDTCTHFHILWYMLTFDMCYFVPGLHGPHVGLRHVNEAQYFGPLLIPGMIVRGDYKGWTLIWSFCISDSPAGIKLLDPYPIFLSRCGSNIFFSWMALYNLYSVAVP